jgi:hypothetical protein
MESNISKLKGVILSSLFSLFLLIFIGCKKNEPLINSSISSDDIQSSDVGSVDNSVDSLAIVDYLDCGAISYGGDFGYDENGKIYYQYESYHYTSDGKFVYESIDGGENGMIECGEELVTESSTNQNMQTQKQWVNCKYCHGSGLKDCYTCAGEGTTHCLNCYNNKESCFRCNGKGTYGDCDECDGRGQVLIEY